MPKDQIALQRAEFDAFVALKQAFDALPPVVDDDYPAARHRYEGRIRDFLRAAAENRPETYLQLAPRVVGS